MNMSKKLANLMSGLPPDVQPDRFEQHDHTLELFVSWPEPGTKEVVCPNCGGSCCVKKDNGALQTVRHLPVTGTGTMVTFHKPRFLCKNCGHSFYIKPIWVAPDMAVTMPLFLDIYFRLASTSASIQSIATDTRTTASIVRNVMNHINLGPPAKLPQTLGIDEFHGDTGSYNKERKRYDTEKYHCVITDADNGAVIDILYKATLPALRTYFMKFPLYERQQVKFFCADLRKGFSSVARECFRNAKICYDPFHIVQLLTKAISDLRVDEWRRLRELWKKADQEHELCTDPETAKTLKAKALALQADYKDVQNSQKLLVTSPYNEDRFWNRNVSLRDAKLERIYSLSPDLKLAREALMQFYDVAHTELKLRKVALSNWIEAYISCECPYIKKAANTISDHRQGIENAWRFHKSNSPTEGLNKKIKDVKRMAFGAHDFQNFRKRAMLACGYVHSLPEPYTIFREKASNPSNKTNPANKKQKEVNNNDR